MKEPVRPWTRSSAAEVRVADVARSNPQKSRDSREIWFNVGGIDYSEAEVVLVAGHLYSNVIFL